MTKALVAYASKNGSTVGIAEAIGETLTAAGWDVDVLDAGRVRDVGPYGAVIAGSAVYASRWRPEAVRFLRRHRVALSERPLWLFQSGPADRSAEEKDIRLPKRVASLATAAGARGQVTFGGRLTEDTPGFIATAMVKRGVAGDFRNFDRIRTWAEGIVASLERAPAGAAREG